MIVEQREEKVTLLGSAFKGLDEWELREMAAQKVFHTYPPDHILCHVGAYENTFYIVSEETNDLKPCYLLRRIYSCMFNNKRRKP